MCIVTNSGLVNDENTFIVLFQMITNSEEQSIKIQIALFSVLISFKFKIRQNETKILASLLAFTHYMIAQSSPVIPGDSSWAGPPHTYTVSETFEN